MTGAFPFAAVVGQTDAKLALRLAALDPLLGGVLLRGEKGSAKTTLARGLSAMLGDAPFVDLPVGATEDRLVGSIDTRAALVDGDVRFEPGLLAAADGGVLYVDEINLLPDHLVDVLLDVAVSGENVVERDGVSHRHPARFVLVGSMNPEEGELRPQLLDRFGLCVEVTAPSDPTERAEAVRRRLAHDAGQAWTEDATATAADPPPAGTDEPTAQPISEHVIDAATRLAVSVGAEGLRADLTLCRAAAAHARLDGRADPDVGDLRRVAPLVLAHRSRRGPFDPPVVAPDTLDDAIDDTLGPPPEPDDTDDTVDDQESRTSDEPGDDRDDRNDHHDRSGERTGGARHQPFGSDGDARRPPLPPSTTSKVSRGRVVGEVAADGTGPVAVLPSVRAATRRRPPGDGRDPAGQGALVDEADLRQQVRTERRSRAIVLCVDLSGSMGAEARADAASGTVLGLLAEAYERRHTVGLVTFGAGDATVVLTPTRSVEVARHRLDHLATGGDTPLALGLETARQVAAHAVDDTTDAVLAVLTDGRATDAGGVDAALDAAGHIRRTLGVTGLVLDCEVGPSRLGLAATLAEAMGAAHVPVAELTASSVSDAVARGIVR